MLNLTYGRILFLEDWNDRIVDCVEQLGGERAHIVKIEIESVQSWD